MAVTKLAPCPSCGGSEISEGVYARYILGVDLTVGVPQREDLRGTQTVLGGAATSPPWKEPVARNFHHCLPSRLARPSNCSATQAGPACLRAASSASSVTTGSPSRWICSPINP